MGCPFSGGGGAIVAGGAGARYTGMIEANISPVGGAVTIIGDITGRQMGGALPCRRCTVVATGTSSKN